MPDQIREILLETIETALQAQLKAVRQLRRPPPPSRAGAGAHPRSGRSQLSIVYDLLQEAAQPLHITQIVDKAQKRFRVKLDRESLVSALTKRIARGDRFTRTAPNTFALLTKDFRKEAE
jgi:hypothetical protein